VVSHETRAQYVLRWRADPVWEKVIAGVRHLHRRFHSQPADDRVRGMYLLIAPGAAIYRFHQRDL
jgi:hypothetical protein